jgi:putative ABC transport system substrate-binding protein
MRRRDFIQALAGTVFASSLSAHAEGPAGVHQIGYLGATSLSEQADRVAALQEGLRRLGYIEGTNITIHYRWDEGRYDRLPDLAAELVRLKVDVILTHGTPGTRAAMAATTTIPIVAIVVGELLSPGLVPSLARPGGNLTGQTFFFAEICAKRVELIKEAIPAVARVAVLVNPDNASHQIAFAAMTATAQTLRLELLPVEARTREDLISAFATVAQKGAQALVLVDDPLLISNARSIAELALRSQIPTIGEKSHTTAGGFMSYGVDLRDFWFTSATLVDRILKGAKPADLPIQQATKFELIISMKNAQALGLALPAALLARADEVIE